MADTVQSDMPDLSKFIATKEDLTYLVEHVTGFVTDFLKESRHSGFCPMLFVLAKTKEDPDRPTIMVFMLDGDFNDKDARRQTMRNIGYQLFEMEVVPIGAVMASEAWRVKMKEGSKREDIPDDLGKCPDREEILGVCGTTLANKISCMAVMIIDRDIGDNTIIPGAFSPTIFSKKGELETNLLNQLWRGFFEKFLEAFGKVE
jgi:hypothetical protein